MKNKNGKLIIGLMLLLSSFIALYNYSVKGCITYFQGITQCGNSALIGILIVISIGFYILFSALKKR